MVSLARDRMVPGTVKLAEHTGLEPTTIHVLAEQLGVRPMAIYHHIASNDAILNVAYSEVYMPSTARRTCLSFFLSPCGRYQNDAGGVLSLMDHECSSPPRANQPCES